MKSRLKFNILLVFACVSLQIFAAQAKDIFEFDGMSIDVSETDFLKKRPEAILLSETDATKNAKTYLYEIVKKMPFQGANVMSSSRGFLSGKGCEVGMGFRFDNTNEAEELISRLKLRYTKIQSRKSLADTNRIIYLENDELYAAIVLYDVNDNELATAIGYSVTLKSCGKDAAYAWQTYPR